jgi:diguanylate cyclase (GGDEF)-like protein/PAS domain S-box-containing protein
VNPDSFPAVESPSTRHVEDILHPHRKALAALMHSDALRRGDVAAALALCTEVASEILKVERASVWQFGPDHSSLECRNLFERTPRRHSQGGDLPAASYPSYFAALTAERTIAAHDAYADPRTSEFGESYLAPHGISAMLDAPVFVRGEMVGVVCHEHVGGKRRWQTWEELVAASIADFVALAIEAAQRNVDEQKLQDHQKELEAMVALRTAELTRANESLQREIAERQGIEARLRASEENLRTLFEISPVALVLSRVSDQRVVFSNRRASELFEISAEDAVGQHTPDFYVDRNDRARLLARIKAEKYVDGFEALLKTAQGRPFPALMSAQLLVFDGEPALLVSASDVTHQKNIEAKLRELATIDALTGCFNRRHFLDVASAELERAQRYRRPLSAAMLDADYFKDINDRYGHDVGDQVLRAIADSCRRTLRKSDVLGRVGGEEFVALFVETELSEAGRVAERLLHDVSELVIQRDGVRIAVTVSAGVVAREPDEVLESILKRADDAMYRAKEAGRNRVAIG